MSLFKLPLHLPGYKFMAMAYLVVAVILIWAGTFPNEYLLSLGKVADAHAFPFVPLALELSLLLLVCWLQIWALSLYAWRRVGRLLVCLVLTGGLAMLSALGVVHSSRQYIYFVLAVIALALADAILIISFSVIALVSQLKLPVTR
jgi:hypothetical protein